MKQLWKKFASLIDERSTRERVMIFATTFVVATMLMQLVLVDPIVAERKQIVQATLNAQAETGKLAAQAQTLVRERGVDPDAALKARLAELEERVSALQRRIDEQSAEVVPPEKMAAVLEKILAGNSRLQLVEVKTLARASITLGKGPARTEPGRAPEAKPQAGDEKKPSEVYRHSVEIAMRGSYLDLLGYLKEIESLPVRMFWDTLKLSVTEYPTVMMRLTVYTISLEKVWLTV